MSRTRAHRPLPGVPLSPGAATRRLADDGETGAGPGAPETVEPTQGRPGAGGHGPAGPGGPVMLGLKHRQRPAGRAPVARISPSGGLALLYRSLLWALGRALARGGPTPRARPQTRDANRPDGSGAAHPGTSDAPPVNLEETG
jgi:hypothetical protein